MQTRAVNIVSNCEDTVLGALETLVSISRTCQNQARFWDSGSSYPNWIDSWCTVHARATRRSGHSTALMEFIARNRVDSAVFSHNARQLEFHRNMCNATLRDHSIDHIEWPQMTEADGFNIHFLLSSRSCWGLGLEPTYVFVDCASHLSNEDMENIKEFASSACNRHREFFLIFLQ